MHKERRAGKVGVEEWVERMGLLVGAALGCGFRTDWCPSHTLTDLNIRKTEERRYVFHSM
jgi:hypothetical protein